MTVQCTTGSGGGCLRLGARSVVRPTTPLETMSDGLRVHGVSKILIVGGRESLLLFEEEEQVRHVSQGWHFGERGTLNGYSTESEIYTVVGCSVTGASAACPGTARRANSSAPRLVFD